METVSRETLGLTQARSGNSGHHPASQLPPSDSWSPTRQVGRRQAETKTGHTALRHTWCTFPQGRVDAE